MYDRRGIWGLLLGAWILWSEVVSMVSANTVEAKLPRDPIQSVWVMHEAFDTKRACEARITEGRTIDRELGIQPLSVTRDGGLTTVISTTYSCWPESIDRRTK
jgi:hypothetical protein